MARFRHERLKIKDRLFPVGMVGVALLMAVYLYAKTITPGGAPMLPPDPDPLPWVSSQTEAIAKAKTSGKPILLDFWAEWCGLCIEMEKTTYRDPEVKRVLKEKFVLWKVDATSDQNQEAMAIVSKFHVYGFPSLLFLKADGTEIQKMRLVGYSDSRRLLDQIETNQKLLKSK